MKKFDLEKEFDIRKFKKQSSVLTSDAWIDELNNYTYTHVRDFFRDVSSRIVNERSRGVQNKSLDLEMLALKLVSEIFFRKRHYNSNELNANPKLKKVDEISKAMSLKALEFEVKSVDDVNDYPYLEELLDAFMLAEDDLDKVMLGIEIGEL